MALDDKWFESNGYVRRDDEMSHIFFLKSDSYYSHYIKYNSFNGSWIYSDGRNTMYDIRTDDELNWIINFCKKNIKTIDNE